MKILIISSNPISTTDNNGKTLRSFFSQFNKEDLATIYFHPTLVPDIKTCDNLYRITDVDVLKSILSLRFKTHNSVIKYHNTTKDNLIKENKLFIWCKNTFKRLPLFRELIWSFQTWNTEELDKWVRDFKPDVIFAMLGDSMFAHRMAVKLSEKHKIPLYVYVTDDYIINDYSSNLIEYIHHKLLLKVYRKTISKAKLCFAIGDKMAEAYSDLFGKKFDVLINCIEVRNTIAPKMALEQNQDIVISYIGGLHYHRWESICKLGNAIKSIPNIRILVFSGTKPDENILKEFAANGVEYIGALDQTGVNDQMHRSHFLLHAESFRKEDILFTQYSVSTKIPEYLFSNRIPICIGPSNIASIEIFKKNNLGIIIDEHDTEVSIKEKLVHFINNYKTFDFKRNIEFAERNFDAQEMRAKLKRQLDSVTTK